MYPKGDAGGRSKVLIRATSNNKRDSLYNYLDSDHFQNLFCLREIMSEDSTVKSWVAKTWTVSLVQWMGKAQEIPDYQH